MIDDIDKYIKDNYPNIIKNELKRKNLMDNNVLILTRNQIGYITNSIKDFPRRIQLVILNYHDWIYIKRDGTICDEFEVIIKDSNHLKRAKELLNHKYCPVIIILLRKSLNSWSSSKDKVEYYRKGWLKMKDEEKQGFNFVEIYNFMLTM